MTLGAAALLTLITPATRPLLAKNSGKELFERRCTGCHALDKDRDGPRLRGVYGKNAATNSGFAYSAALKKSGVTWNDTTLDQWLKDTDAMIPGNDMEFRVKNAQERADLIAFLRQSK